MRPARWRLDAPDAFRSKSESSISGGANSMSQSVLRNVRQQDRRESVDEFSPASRLRTAFREIPLLSANVCCDRLSANLNALRLLPSVFSSSFRVLYTITCLIRTKIGCIVAQHSLKGQYRLYNVRRVTYASVEAYVAPLPALRGFPRSPFSET